MKNLGKFATFAAALVGVAVLATPTALFADAIPYPNVGTPVTGPNTIQVFSTSALWFYGFSAGDTDFVNIIDVTKATQSGWIFQNNVSSGGSQVPLATNVGDFLVVELFDQSKNDYFYSNGAAPSGPISCVGASTALLPCTTTPAAAAENVDHAYLTPFSGGVINGVSVPAGLFVGMEDLLPPPAQTGDYDYNDDQFILTGVSATPEPSSLMLLGTGLTGAAGMLFRRRRKA